jgi:hypothetical protein
LLDSDALRAEAGARPVRRERPARTRGGRARLVLAGKIAVGALALLLVLAAAAGIAFAGSASRIAAGVSIQGSTSAAHGGGRANSGAGHARPARRLHGRRRVQAPSGRWRSRRTGRPRSRMPSPRATGRFPCAGSSGSGCAWRRRVGGATAFEAALRAQRGGPRRQAPREGPQLDGLGPDRPGLPAGARPRGRRRRRRGGARRLRAAPTPPVAVDPPR